MRRVDREITAPNEILAIMQRCKTLHLALFDGEFPYSVPLSFGVKLENGVFALYFHGALQGKKLNLIAKNPHCAFSMSSEETQPGDRPCDYTMKYESVCGRGELVMLSDEEKIDAMSLLMRNYSSERDFVFDEKVLNRTAVMKIMVSEITGKSNMK